MKSVILNAFSLNMLREEVKTVDIIPVGVIEEDMAYQEDGEKMDIFHFANSISGIGHADTAALIQALYPQIAPHCTFNRASIKLMPGDVALVFQYRGPRLPEGSTSLPSGASIIPVIVRCKGVQTHQDCCPSAGHTAEHDSDCPVWRASQREP